MNDWLERLALRIIAISGRGFDAKACPLPAFKPYEPPTAAIPKEKKPPKPRSDDGLLSPEEMKNWRYYGGSPGARKIIQEIENEKPTPAAVEIEFDSRPSEMHGITEREYGEMLAYNPPLNNLELAGAIKRLKPSKKLAEIAQMLNVTEQVVRHYSSALKKASASPAKK